MKTSAVHGQEAQTQSRDAREPVKLGERLAFSVKEVAAALGRSPTYAYRQIYAGRIRAISDAGRLLIPRSEIDRFLSGTTEYNPKRVQPKRTTAGRDDPKRPETT